MWSVVYEIEWELQPVELNEQTSVATIVNLCPNSFLFPKKNSWAGWGNHSRYSLTATAGRWRILVAKTIKPLSGGFIVG